MKKVKNPINGWLVALLIFATAIMAAMVGVTESQRDTIITLHSANRILACQVDVYGINLAKAIRNGQDVTSQDFNQLMIDALIQCDVKP